ncbi:AmmeMemoRadiSam system protein B [Patescibacteria group bacterium]|nr:AmmeMemoRadiSam system protein B [Patescibacteria group bacterium]
MKIDGGGWLKSSSRYFFMQKRNRYFHLIIIIVILVFFSMGCNSKQVVVNEGRDIDIEVENNGLDKYNEVINTKFLDEKVLRRVLENNFIVLEQKPIAGIINHHVLAADLQAKFFMSLNSSRSDIENFYIISPDHFSAGSGVSCHQANYSTVFGVVESDVEKVDLLTDVGCRLYDGYFFNNEHGVGSLMPYIKFYFPEAKVVPIFIHIDIPRKNLIQFGKDLQSVVSGDDFIIISSDMSHYLTDEKARINDKMTRSWLAENNWDQLKFATDAFTDSAGGFALLQGFFSTKAVIFEEMDYAISTEYGADPNNTTSYINGFYYLKTP